MAEGKRPETGFLNNGISLSNDRIDEIYKRFPAIDVLGVFTFQHRSFARAILAAALEPGRDPEVRPNRVPPLDVEKPL